MRYFEFWMGNVPLFLGVDQIYSVYKYETGYYYSLIVWK